MTKELIILGAGASREAGIPLASELPLALRDELLDRVKSPRTNIEVDSDSSGDLSLAKRNLASLDFLLQKLDPKEGTSDVEAILRAIDFLAVRDTNELTRFVDIWSHELEAIEGNTLPRVKSDGWLTDPPQFKNPSYFDGLKFTLLSYLSHISELPWKRSSDLAYLRPLLEYSHSNDNTIVTLNYDLTLEYSCSHIELPFARGIENWNFGRGVFFPDSKLRIIKLHGSFDWQMTYEGFHSPRNFTSWPLESPNQMFNPLILYGANAKLDPYGPFFDLFSEFRDTLQQVDLVSVIGFSFRDDHITEHLFQWLKGDESRVIRVANGKEFSKDKIPVRLKDTCYSSELRERTRIFPLNASEAISEWYVDE